MSCRLVNDVIGNQLDLAILVSISAVPHARSKQVKAIAVTDDKRLASLPEVPTVAETAGFKGFDVVAWTGLFAPAHTPPAIVERLTASSMRCSPPTRCATSSPSRAP